MRRIELLPHRCPLCLGPFGTIRAVRAHLRDHHGVLAPAEREGYVEAMRTDTLLRAARELEGR